MQRLSLLLLIRRAVPASAVRVSRLRTVTTAATEAVPATPAVTATATPAPTAAAPTTPVRLPFYIGRSHSDNLPVYHRKKSGGTNLTTEVKKVEGDARVLAQQIRDDLHLETKVNPRTNDVVIKGLHREKLVEWLNKRGL